MGHIDLGMGMLAEFEDLVRQHLARIRRIASRYAEGRSVDDPVQDILVRLWRSYPNFRADAQVETWVYRVALNASMTYVRGAIRERKGQAAIKARSPPTSAAPAADASMGDVLTGFLTRLGDIDASILMMYLDGLSADEMSGVLGISGNAIAVRINRLKQKFSDTYVD
jgi:RNA polymerase sigma-70 factor (ECF subfamily)